ncbi:hypothetical protein [Caldalkalibacillus salinus]|uniref:hypothetical protein n=1 Tax=Caldalkalibacillus salinus TaxID=2803787 RepID=UPI0019209D4A|nr:hypothetical protein [Caldalkalibacillus salinus]
MRVPSPALIDKLTRYIATFVLGAVIGAIIILYIHGSTLNDVMKQNRQLTLDNIKLMDDIETLEEDKSELSRQRQQKIAIRRIDVQIVQQPDEDPIDELVEKEMAEHLRRDLKFLIQLPLESVAETSEAIHHLVNESKYDIQQQRYGLQLKTLVVYSTLTVKVQMIKLDE